jgi:hypothetical protein
MSAMNDRASPALRSGRFDAVPGWELVRAGLADLAAGRVTIEGELVRSASERLAGLGIVADDGDLQPVNRLYELVEAEVGPARAHGRYNALRRRLASFLRAAPHARPG